MDSVKSSWILYLSNHRNSRRQDMRHYMTMCRDNILAIVIAFGLSIINSGNMDWKLCTFIAFLAFILFISLVYFIGQYFSAEKQIKAYTDAIDFIYMARPLSNEAYHKLNYLVGTQNWIMQTEIGLFLSRQQYLIIGLPWIRDVLKERYLERYGETVPLIKMCHENPEQVIADIIEEAADN